MGTLSARQALLLQVHGTYPEIQIGRKKISYIELYPCGSAAGTIRDLATYAQAFVSDDVPLFEHRETQEKMFEGTQFYGSTDIPMSSCGFWCDEYKVRTFGHNGATISCHSNMLFDRGSKVGLVTLTNETSANLAIEGIPKLIFGSPDTDSLSDGDKSAERFDGFYLTSRSARSGIMKLTSYLSPINANMYPDLTRLGDGFYSLGDTGMLLGVSKRTDGTDAFILGGGAMEIDRDKAYPAEISLLALYFVIAAGSVFVLLYKFKAARKGRYSLTAVGAVQTAGQLIKLVSVAAAFVIIAYSGREAFYGIPKAVGVGAGTLNIICIAVCAAAAAASLAAMIMKKTEKWAKIRCAVNIAANSVMIAAIIYFEMYTSLGC